jgi:hypothetical protein
MEFTVELVYAIVDKYIDQFIKRFPDTIMKVYFEPTGQPEMPPELWDDDAETVVSGRFLKVNNEYRIGVNNQLGLPGHLLAFFHEYGHAEYRRETNEEIIDTPALIRTETAALRSSLRLADAEKLPEVAYLAVDAAHTLATMGPVYQAAMERMQTDPLWEKYSKRPSD